MKRASVISAGAFVLACAAVAPAGVLYDGSLLTTPAAQGWLYNLPAIPTISGSISTAAGGTTLNTTGINSQRNGWSTYTYANATPTLVNPALPSLDCASGFSILLALQLTAESHASTDRSGVSLIVLDANHRGIELEFWTDTVWAQSASPLFTHGEQAALDTTRPRQYELQASGNVYRLLADDVQVLTGDIRDYSAWSPPSGQPNLYALPNFIFLGDNTTSAAGTFCFSQLATVPEPAAAALIPALGLVLARRRRSRL